LEFPAKLEFRASIQAGNADKGESLLQQRLPHSESNGHFSLAQYVPDKSDGNRLRW
jgi:hypothetical protein